MFINNLATHPLWEDKQILGKRTKYIILKFSKAENPSGILVHLVVSKDRKPKTCGDIYLKVNWN